MVNATTQQNKLNFAKRLEKVERKLESMTSKKTAKEIRLEKLISKLTGKKYIGSR